MFLEDVSGGSLRLQLLRATPAGDSADHKKNPGAMDSGGFEPQWLVERARNSPITQQTAGNRFRQPRLTRQESMEGQLVEAMSRMVSIVSIRSITVRPRLKQLKQSRRSATSG